MFDIFKKLEGLRPAAPTGPVEAIVAGLGNPGREYENTRHNAGFLVLDQIAGRRGVRLDRLKYKSLCADAVLGGRRVLLMKPQTFMNLSGQAVTEAMRFYKAAGREGHRDFRRHFPGAGQAADPPQEATTAGITGSKTSYICRERTPFPGLKWEWAKSPGPTIIWRTGCCHGSPSRNSRPWKKRQSGPPRPRS